MSYKGGDPGFVRVLDSRTIAFPCYDGNGMFYSMGNLIGTDQIGMLFVSFERPHRLRVQGIASVDDNDPLLGEFFEAQMVVRVTVTEIFRNCPRYVHRYTKIAESEYVPKAECKTPLAAWKRVDDVQAALLEEGSRAGGARRRQYHASRVRKIPTPATAKTGAPRLAQAARGSIPQSRQPQGASRQMREPRRAECLSYRA